jgi:hypothetical protein
LRSKPITSLILKAAEGTNDLTFPAISPAQSPHLLKIQAPGEVTCAFSHFRRPRRTIAQHNEPHHQRNSASSEPPLRHRTGPAHNQPHLKSRNHTASNRIGAAPQMDLKSRIKAEAQPTSPSVRVHTLLFRTIAQSTSPCCAAPFFQRLFACWLVGFF